MSENVNLVLPKMIAIIGREGSGKDSYGDYLAELGYLHISAGEALRERARDEGFSDPIPREVLSKIGDKLKSEFGPSPITESSIKQYQENIDHYPAGLVISGLRRVGEIEAFKKHGAVILWINADTKRRFHNLYHRDRGDHLDLESYKKQSDAEYYGTTEGGSSGVNLKAVEEYADCRVNNDKSLEELFINSNKILSNYLTKAK